MAMSDNRTETTVKVVAAIAVLWEEGCPVAMNPEETAPIAIRRWNSSARRGVKQSDIQARIRDLAKGLVARFEQEPELVGPLMRDYECVAARVAAVLHHPADNHPMQWTRDKAQRRG
jgi:hypothetical protein